MILRKTENLWFPDVKNFWDVMWHFNCHQSKALVIRKKFCCHEMCLNGLLLLKETMKCSQAFSKKLFWRSILGSKITPFLRCLILLENHVSTILPKNIENNPYNVYIFWMAQVRVLQNWFNHVCTTPVDVSTSSRLGVAI